MRPFHSPEVAAKFDAYPPNVRRKLLALRELVFRTAEVTPGVGEIDESLKWGQPAYITKNKGGSTLRIDWKKADPNHCAMYFHCQTNLVERFRAMFPRDFKFEGNRALLFALTDEVSQDALTVCIAASLTYYSKNKALGSAARRPK